MDCSAWPWDARMQFLELMDEMSKPKQNPNPIFQVGRAKHKEEYLRILAQHQNGPHQLAGDYGGDCFGRRLAWPPAHLY